MRTINLTVEIKDDDFTENNFYKWCQGQFVDALKDYRVLPNTNELYENDPKFRELCKKEKEAKRVKAEYINKYNHK